MIFFELISCLSNFYCFIMYLLILLLLPLPLLCEKITAEAVCYANLVLRYNMVKRAERKRDKFGTEAKFCAYNELQQHMYV